MSTLKSRLPLVVSIAALLAAPGGASAARSHGHAGAAAAIAKAEAVLVGDASASGAGSVDLTMLLRRVAIAAPSLGGNRARRADRLLARPTDERDLNYIGPEAKASPLCSAEFCVHWAEQGKSSPKLTDANSNEAPDFVDEIIEAGATVYNTEHSTLRWQVPPTDRQLGGTSQVDIYVAALPQGLYGFSAPDPGQKRPRRFSYLVLDDDYKGFGGSTLPIGLMRATLAHEYTNVIQLGYDVSQDPWMFEASATWMEEQVFPDNDDWINLVGDFSNLPAIPLTSPRKMYGTSIFLHWLSSRYGPKVVRNAWEGSRAVKGDVRSLDAFSNSISALGGVSIADEFNQFAPLTAEFAAAGSPLPNADMLPPTVPIGKITEKSAEYSGKIPSLSSVPLQVQGSYATGTMELFAQAEKGAPVSAYIVARVGPANGGTVTSAVVPLPDGGKGSVQFTIPPDASNVTVVLVNYSGKYGSSWEHPGSAKTKMSLLPAE